MADEQQPDDGLTVRERRAQHAKQSARKGAPIKLARKAIVPAIIVLVIAGISAGFYFTSKQQAECPGHWHAAYGVFVNNETVSYANPGLHAVAYGSTGHDHHIHGDDGIYHFHPAALRCISTTDMMDKLGVEVQGATMTLGPEHGDLSGTYAPAGNATLQIWHQPYGKDWRQVTWAAIDERQLGDGDRILFTYGDVDAGMLAYQQATLKDLGNYDPGDT